MTGEKRADGGARNVRIGLSEGAIGGAQVRSCGERGGRLGVEDGGVLGVGDGRRQRRLHDGGRLDAHRPGLGGDGVVEDQERAERHRLGEDRKSEQANHRPLRGAGRRGVGGLSEAADGDRQPPDERRESDREHGTEPVRPHPGVEGEPSACPQPGKEGEDGEGEADNQQERPEPGAIAAGRGGRAGGRPEEAGGREDEEEGEIAHRHLSPRRKRGGNSGVSATRPRDYSCIAEGPNGAQFASPAESHRPPARFTNER